MLEKKLKGRIEQLHFEGFVKGHTMGGFVRIEGEPDVKVKWQAMRVPSTFRSIDK